MQVLIIIVINEDLVVDKKPPAQPGPQGEKEEDGDGHGALEEIVDGVQDHDFVVPATPTHAVQHLLPIHHWPFTLSLAVSEASLLLWLQYEKEATEWEYQYQTENTHRQEL